MFGACRADQRQILGLVELNFLDKLLTLRTDFGPNLGFLNWMFADFQAWEHEKLPNLRILGRKFDNL